MKKNNSANILSVLSLVLVLFGPILMYVLQKICYSTGSYFRLNLANTLFYICSFTPIIGFIMSFVLLFSWKSLGKVFKGIDIATIFLGIPFFLFVNYLLCAFASREIANIPWM